MNPLEQAFQGILSGGNYSVKGTGSKPVGAPKKAPAKPSGGFMTSAPQKGGNGKAQPDPGGDLSTWKPPFKVQKGTKRYSK